MSKIHKAARAWKTAKGVCLAYVLSLAAGWLSRVWFKGQISPENKAALLILLATVGTIIVVFCTVGIRRWRRDELSVWEKRLMVFSLLMFVVMFLVGWFSDIEQG